MSEMATGVCLRQCAAAGVSRARSAWVCSDMCSYLLPHHARVRPCLTQPLVLSLDVPDTLPRTFDWTTKQVWIGLSCRVPKEQSYGNYGGDSESRERARFGNVESGPSRHVMSFISALLYPLFLYLVNPSIVF